jgi:predicted alpha/beta hydrolase family esterase
MTKILIAPGLGSSGPKHWQTIWEKEHPEYKRIVQTDWERPLRIEWVQKIEEEVNAAGTNTIIVAHSLACIALVYWAQRTSLKIKGALLVAPPDTEDKNFPKEAAGFSPIPLQPLPFRTIVVGSSNDQYITEDKCIFLSENWGSKYVSVGFKGHINSDSNLGSWIEGKRILHDLLNSVNELSL